MEARIDARQLARALGNALIFCPKKEPWDHVLYTFHPDRVVLITSDSIAAHEETCLAEVHPPPEYPANGKASRVDAEGLLERAKGAKGEIRLQFEEGVSLVYRDHLPDNALALEDVYRDADVGDSWDDLNIAVFQGLLEERQELPGTHRFMLNTDYFRKLAMLKAGPGVAADLWVHGDDPFFAQKGPWSRTVIQPIDRHRHAAKNGDEVLWET